MFEKPTFALIIAFTMFTAFVTFFITVLLIKMKKRQNIKNKLHLQALLDERENTMRSIAMELHDNIHQMQQMQGMDLFMLEEYVNPKASEIMGRLKSRMERLMFDTQNISHYLNPKYVRNIGFIPALQEVGTWLNATNRIRCEINIEGERQNLPDQASLMAFRIAQEAIQNVLKYAQADRVSIRLSFGQQDFELRITDNGKGIEDMETYKAGSGIENLHQRASIINGKLNLFSVPGNGTTVLLTLPSVFNGLHDKYFSPH